MRKINQSSVTVHVAALSRLWALLPLFVLACGDDGGELSGATQASVSGVTTQGTSTTADAPTTTGSTTEDPVSGSETQAAATTEPGTTTTGEPTGTSTAPGTSEGTSEGTTGGPLVLHCSGDLHDVLDPFDAVVETCGSDEACLDGACQPVCDVFGALQGTAGCDFWAPTPPFYANGLGQYFDGPCFAVFLANAWSGPAHITVSRGGQSFDITQHARIPKSDGAVTTYELLPPEGLPPDEVAILFLSHKPGVKNGTSLECPVPPALLQDTAVPGTGVGEAFHVTTDVPVSAYDINPYGGAASYLPSASLLFPATSWGTNHMSITPAPGEGGMFTMVVAREDDTVVKVAPTVTLPGGGGQAEAPAGVTTEYTLSAGQILQWSKQGNNLDSSGTILDSDKPIGLWTGNTYIAVASATLGPGGRDSAHQQIAPVRALGNAYVGAGVVTRLIDLAPESVPYRMVGVVDDTALTWDPSAPPGAPTALAAGQVVQFETTSFFSVRSQDPEHPFLFSQYMSGTGGVTRPGCSPNQSCGLGDEEWVSLLSARQFQNRYIFFTDPTYATTNLVIVRASEGGVFADVKVECLGTVGGWMPVGGQGEFEVAHVDLERGNVPAAGCGTSRHLAESDGPFGVVVWGTDSAASYGYPAGSDISKINEVTLPVPG
ncbi:IgGFc-binding protein [Nannocystis bainbridge]|uniref:IgGFc-binding protein n=1 Tax=Nannocystis bainbridge TaxID=2995303 RepID=A0ABT5DRU2_9BACT|nr:IgGFc-binding protein [Nannocystis bainbridge]MDC0715779.1 IgGFc-binding protein [Nannocystis bainbridge]